MQTVAARVVCELQGGIIVSYPVLNKKCHSTFFSWFSSLLIIIVDKMLSLKSNFPFLLFEFLSYWYYQPTDYVTTVEKFYAMYSIMIFKKWFFLYVL